MHNKWNTLEVHLKTKGDIFSFTLENFGEKTIVKLGKKNEVMVNGENFKKIYYDNHQEYMQEKFIRDTSYTMPASVFMASSKLELC